MGPLSLSEVFGENKQIAKPEAEVKKKQNKTEGEERNGGEKKKTHEKSNGVRRRNLLGAV